MQILLSPPLHKWDTYVRSKQGLPNFALSAWKKTIDCSLPVRSVLLAVADDSGEIRGGLLAYHLPAPGRVLYSVPYGLLADNVEASITLATAIRDYCSANHIVRTQLSSGTVKLPIPGLHWVRTTVVLDIDADEKIAWDSMSGKTRNMVRKARKHDVSVSVGPDQIDHFYDAYSSRLIEKGVNLLPRPFFHALSEALDNDLVFYGAQQNGAAIAGVVFFYSNDVTAYVYNGCLPEFMSLGVNNLLFWHAGRDASERGSGFIDLGESRPGSGVYNYKRKGLRGEPRELHYYDVLCDSTKERAPITSNFAERILSALSRLQPILPPQILKLLAVRRAKYGKLI